ncbi:MAG: 16S rRNA (cytosine(1402)-N(4))-methyltransferase RsmH [Muribaculaceae bacterium]|nr:16S rRNA (cytosine(1402)-N(4))-methyltransferase RsmH [Muribaculaceae bacterium]
MKMTDTPYHIPALFDQSLDALHIKASGVYVDCTLGGGGHTRGILGRLAQAWKEEGGPCGRLLSFDQDTDAIERALNDPELRLHIRPEVENGNDESHPQEGPELTLVHGNFRYLTNFLRFYGAGQVDGILADLGVSFHHFDDPERGFSFRWDGELDMRMNRKARISAATLLAEADEVSLARIFSLYGELRQSRRIAAAIVKARAAAPITTVPQLLEAVKPFISPRQEKKELAQLFQALRIEVNAEMEALRALLVQAGEALRPGGRLAIITYHSLEDRLVKNFLRTGNLEGKEEKDFFGRNLSPFRLLTGKPIVPDQEEVERNPRSRSAKLRVAERL